MSSPEMTMKIKVAVKVNVMVKVTHVRLSTLTLNDPIPPYLDAVLWDLCPLVLVHEAVPSQFQFFVAEIVLRRGLGHMAAVLPQDSGGATRGIGRLTRNCGREKIVPCYLFCYG
jgi:hypothetical protein